MKSPVRVRDAVLRPDRVVAAGLVLIALQLVLRGWALAGSWFYFDDLAFMSQALNKPLGADVLLQSYGGHLSPAGFSLAYLLTSVSAFTWWPWALSLLVMQALAGIGMLRLLVSLFGRRPIVLALLTGYLFYVFALSAGLWWAAGINQLPLLISLTFGLHAFVDHLRSRRVRPLVLAVAWTVVGLLFYEKTVLLIGVYALVALLYFTRGDLPDRLRGLWRDYKAATIAFALLGAGYVGLYLALDPDISAGGESGGSWGRLVWNLVMVAFASAVVGGPLSWQSVGVGSLADPATLLQLVGWVAVAGLAYHAFTTRTRSARAWLPLAFTLLCNAVLLVSNRAAVGAEIAREYRYQPESGALFVIAVGLAMLPLVGAPEQNVRRERAAVPWERIRYVAPGVTVVAVLAVVSSIGYVQNWQNGNRTRDYIETVQKSLAEAETPPALIDVGIPQDLLWSYRYPENTYSWVFRWLDDQTSFPGATVDELSMFDDAGHLVPVSLPPARSMVPTDGCGYQLGADGSVSVPLDGPVFGGGWWIQLSYVSHEDVDVEVVSGDSTHTIRLPRGIHNLYVSAEGEFDSVEVREDGQAGTDSGPRPCVTGLTVGLPVPTPSRTP